MYYITIPCDFALFTGIFFQFLSIFYFFLCHFTFIYSQHYFICFVQHVFTFLFCVHGCIFIRLSTFPCILVAVSISMHALSFLVVWWTCSILMSAVVSSTFSTFFSWGSILTIRSSQFLLLVNEYNIISITNHLAKA